jgi:hypothetical protein
MGIYVKTRDFDDGNICHDLDDRNICGLGLTRGKMGLNFFKKI